MRGELNYGFPLPLPHSSLWLRGAAGWASGDRKSTVANFYFGGFGNNYVDDKSIKRYRNYDSLPEGMLLMRESGFDVPMDEATQAKLEELHYLETSIGKTGLRALKPMRHISDKELWQLNMLRE